MLLFGFTYHRLPWRMITPLRNLSLDFFFLFSPRSLVCCIIHVSVHKWSRKVTFILIVWSLCFSEQLTAEGNTPALVCAGALDWWAYPLRRKIATLSEEHAELLKYQLKHTKHPGYLESEIKNSTENKCRERLRRVLPIYAKCVFTIFCSRVNRHITGMVFFPS
jgi:hypothetical protein